MALKTSLRLIARKIAEAVRKAASVQGLTPGDYVLVGSFDEDTERISLTLGTDRPVDDRLWYADIFQELRRSFPEAPQVTMHIGLVIRRVRALDEVYWDTGGTEDEVDLTEMLTQK